MEPADKLALNAFKTDEETHIVIQQETCRECQEQYCLYVCPGGLYSFNEDTGDLVVEYSGCLECGSCRVACPHGALEWNYPCGRFGVQYRYG